MAHDKTAEASCLVCMYRTRTCNVTSTINYNTVRYERQGRPSYMNMDGSHPTLCPSTRLSFVFVLCSVQ